MLGEARRDSEGRKGEKEGTVSAGTGEDHEEDINVPEGRKMEGDGKVSGRV